ncbi:MAG: flavin reductase family protein [Proteobacteria bacterium]|nr:flavin reductase family protein [Pseudomonadota bacterium]
MNQDHKKTALRMIPYGLFVLTSETDDHGMVASTVTFVSQTSMTPPLLMTAIKKKSHTYEVVKQSGQFALNILGKDQIKTCTKFYTSHTKEGQSIAGEQLEAGVTGTPLLVSTPAFLECIVSKVIEIGDHPIFIAEIVNAGIRKQPEGRPDESILLMRDLGPKAFYGG